MGSRWRAGLSVASDVCQVGGLLLALLIFMGYSAGTLSRPLAGAVGLSALAVTGVLAWCRRRRWAGVVKGGYASGVAWLAKPVRSEMLGRLGSVDVEAGVAGESAVEGAKGAKWWKARVKRLEDDDLVVLWWALDLMGAACSQPVIVRAGLCFRLEDIPFPEGVVLSLFWSACERLEESGFFEKWQPGAQEQTAAVWLPRAVLKADEHLELRRLVGNQVASRGQLERLKLETDS
jgi:hypothetical protein